ncbi:MAG: NADP-dependent oxidoreductase [Rhodospirillales bacterium CG15_BIG_FIL_POST_REV_8_21_14_020_66_15]|nr:MAG: NADP-dependent oxidoreductase [Rhodospirillales bacterium CG15_BIG_FIL_POST_REV_8_21_14_020_66_15]
MTTNRQIIFKSRPEGWVTPDTFGAREVPLPGLGERDVLVRAIYMSLDPYMRGRMDAAKSYAAGFQLGEPLQARVIGAVAASRNSDYAEGALVFGTLDWADYTLVPGGKGLRAIDPAAAGVPLTWHLGALGMPGMTAWVGLGFAEPTHGDTLFVSAASGAVGQIVGQIGRLRGCRVVGSAGTDAKVDFLKNDLGFDAAFNYRTAGPDILSALQAAAPGGLDIYFDNVGGAVLEAALDAANRFARFVECGMISQYNLTRDETPGIRNMTHVVRKAIRMQGFIVSDHADRRADFEAEMIPWLKAGKVKYRVDVAEGLENAPTAFIAMLKGGNFGKQVVRIGREP